MSFTLAGRIVIAAVIFASCALTSRANASAYSCSGILLQVHENQQILAQKEQIKKELAVIARTEIWQRSSSPTPYIFIRQINETQLEPLATLALSNNLSSETILEIFNRVENGFQLTLFKNKPTELQINDTIKLIDIILAGEKIKRSRDLFHADIFISDVRKIWENTFTDEPYSRRREPPSFIRSYLDTKMIIRLMEYKENNNLSTDEIISLFNSPESTDGMILKNYLIKK